MPSMAEDVVQDVFFKAWKYRTKLPEINSPIAWLMVLTKHALANVYRLELQHKNILQNYVAQVHPHINQDEIIEKDYSYALHRAVQDLPPRQKEVFELSFDLQLKRQEIAAILDISPFTVKVTLQHARENVRQVMLKLVA